MRLLFVIDGRSPIALNWVEYFVQTGHEVHLVSTRPCTSNLPLTSLNIIPVAFGEVAGRQSGNRGGDPSWLRTLIPVRWRTVIKQRVAPRTLPSAARHLQQLISEIKPDLVHAMRIPYEGMLTALAGPDSPLLVSVWGNDFTLHASSTPRMRNLTRLTLQRADALHTDCERDRRLATAWGFSPQKPIITLPGAGGVRLNMFKASALDREKGKKEPLIINPRGVRAYVRNDTFFNAIPLVLAQEPQARFICPGMAGESQILNQIERLDISQSVTLLSKMPQADMATLFRQSDIAVSITEHDGTPNTLLEALACGCFPIAGDIETLREWITPGMNGFLVPPGDPQALAQAILLALEQPELRQRAKAINLQMIKERADYYEVMPRVLAFYQSLI
ncbi:MAG: glycosyltransferase family 4 protein [Anaerolineales bacterium]|nr:glycosyltransferase family 4 protein [Anaerolineales bacterium]